MSQRETFGLAETREAVEAVLDEASMVPSHRMVEEKEID